MTSSRETSLAGEARAIKSAPRLTRYLWVLRHQDRPLWFVIGRVLMACGLSSFIRLRHSDYSLRFFNSSMSLEMWLHPKREPGRAERLFRRYLRKGDVVVDVGANIGLYTMICAVTVGDTGRVFAIEPNPRVAGYLNGNVALNHARNVTVFNVALGEAAGTVRFSDQNQDDGNRIVEDGAGTNVPVVRLDRLPLPESEVALLKIDVEGYEKFVLDGATGMLPRVQCVFIETWEVHFSEYGYSCADVHTRLRAQGFQLFRFDGDRLRAVEAGYISVTCEDLVCVRDPAAFTRRSGYSTGSNTSDATCAATMVEK